MAEHGSSAALAGLVVEAVEWLPSGADSGLVRVRGRWIDASAREERLPALGLRRADEARRFDSLPDARFGRDPAVWRGTYLVPAALMDPAPDELWLAWESGARAALPAPARGFEPPAAPVQPAPPEPRGEVIDRAVLAERRARRAEAAEQAQARRAAEALKAVEVLELRSAELERRLEALQEQAPPDEPAARTSATPAAPSPAEPEAPSSPALATPAFPRPSRAEPVTDAAAARALADAVAAVKRLRLELGEQRHRLRRSELLRAADAVALAGLREEDARARQLQSELTASERELAQALATAEARAADAAAAREQAARAAQRSAADAAAVRSRAAEELAAVRSRAAEQLAAARSRAGEELAAARSRAAEELAAARAEAAEARADLEGTGRDLTAERAAHVRTREQLAGRERELASIGDELARVRAELATARRHAEQRAAELERRLAELDAALDAERRAHRSTATDRETARAGLALAESARSAESVARAALDDELDRERAARTMLAEALDASQAELTAAATTQSDLVLSREQARAELAAASDRAARLGSELEAARGELGLAQARIAELERELESTGQGLQARIAELEQAVDGDLVRRAREQEAAAAAAIPRPGDGERRELSESLDAAAATLRARAADDPAVPPPAAPVAPSEAARPAEPPPSDAPPPADPTTAAARPARPQIVTEARHPARADVVGRSKREYPWLRGALVKLAHDDQRAATRLLLGLVPAQRALVQPPLEYDLTIRGSGTYAISIGEQGAAARSIGGPRPRDEASFHATADIVTLTELLAGVEKRMGRWFGSIKLHGRRRDAEALRAVLAGAGLDLAAAARAGADLDPDLVFRAFAYAIHPSWTKGHTFTVAQEISGPRPIRWHVAVRDGRPVTVERRAPAEPPDAVVAMTRATFAHLLRAEHAPSGERPVIRGDRAAVALLKSWTDRAQGRV